MWTLIVSRLNDPPGSYLDKRQLDAGQLIVGRSKKSADLVLPDEQGFVSREHCVIAALGIDLFVTDTSKNGVALNTPGQRILPAQPVAIRPGDRLIINDFVIAVSTPEAARTMSMTPPPMAPLPQASTAGDDIWGAGEANPFLGDMGGSKFGDGGLNFGSEVHDFLAGPGGLGASPAAPPPPDPLPPMGNFGFGEPFGQAYEARPIMAEVDPFSSSLAIPDDWANPGNGVGDGLPIPDFAFSPQGGSPPPPPPLPPIEPGVSNPFAGLDAPFGVLPPLGEELQPEAPFAPIAAPPPPAVSPPPPAALAGPSGSANWAAFYEGAGFSPDELKLPPDAMFRLGVFYRQVLLALCDILQDRATFKDEFRVERTQMSGGRNNPLKHLPAFEAAKVVLGNPLPGFMDGEEALRTAFEDIKRHQMAMLAGVQNALTTVFSRLSPAEMEKLVAAAEGDKKGLFSRRTDRWSIYVTIYENLRKDATSNANGVMGSAFREGYEKFTKSVR
jgi:predicted component of type VI protein secretion system